MHKNPIAVCIEEYCWVYILYNYENRTRESNLKKARPHAPVDKV